MIKAVREMIRDEARTIEMLRQQGKPTYEQYREAGLSSYDAAMRAGRVETWDEREDRRAAANEKARQQSEREHAEFLEREQREKTVVFSYPTREEPPAPLFLRPAPPLPDAISRDLQKRARTERYLGVDLKRLSLQNQTTVTEVPPIENKNWYTKNKTKELHCCSTRNPPSLWIARAK